MLKIGDLLKTKPSFFSTHYGVVLSAGDEAVLLRFAGGPRTNVASATIRYASVDGFCDGRPCEVVRSSSQPTEDIVWQRAIKVLGRRDVGSRQASGTEPRCRGDYPS